jgi:predicted RNase H-like HicB family nuclease
MKHYTLPIIIERDADGFFVSCPALQGCYTQGTDYDEAIAHIKDAIRLHLEDRHANHEELMESPSDGETAPCHRSGDCRCIREPAFPWRGKVVAT